MLWHQASSVAPSGTAVKVGPSVLEGVLAAAVLGLEGACDGHAERIGDSMEKQAAVLALAGGAVHELDVAVGAEDRPEAGEDGFKFVEIAVADVGMFAPAGFSLAEPETGDAGGAVTVEAEQKDFAGDAHDLVDGLLDAVAHAADDDGVSASGGDVFVFHLVEAWIEDVNAVDDGEVFGGEAGPGFFANNAVGAEAIEALEFFDGAFGARSEVTVGDEAESGSIE
jgi:hypothetical protein